MQQTFVLLTTTMTMLTAQRKLPMMMMTMTHVNYYYYCIHSIPYYNCIKLLPVVWSDKMLDWPQQIQNNANSLQKRSDQYNLNHTLNQIVDSSVGHTQHYRIPMPMNCTNRPRAFAPVALPTCNDCYSSGLYCWCCLTRWQYYFVYNCRQFDRRRVFAFACMDLVWVEPRVHFVDCNNWPKQFRRAMFGRRLQLPPLPLWVVDFLRALHYFDAVSNGDGHNSAGNCLPSNNLNWNGPCRERSH